MTINDQGIFWFTTVAPGPYSVTAEHQGFKVIHIPELTLTVNQSFTFEAHLELGAVATTMEVKASELPTIELENAQISNLVNSKRIQVPEALLLANPLPPSLVLMAQPVPRSYRWL